MIGCLCTVVFQVREWQWRYVGVVVLQGLVSDSSSRMVKVVDYVIDMLKMNERSGKESRLKLFEKELLAKEMIGFVLWAVSSVFSRYVVVDGNDF